MVRGLICSHLYDSLAPEPQPDHVFPLARGPRSAFIGEVDGVPATRSLKHGTSFTHDKADLSHAAPGVAGRKSHDSEVVGEKPKGKLSQPKGEKAKTQESCIPNTHGPACSADGDCASVSGCVRCAKSGYCTDVPLPGKKSHDSEVQGGKAQGKANAVVEDQGSREAEIEGAPSQDSTKAKPVKSQDSGEIEKEKPNGPKGDAQKPAESEVRGEHTSQSVPFITQIASLASRIYKSSDSDVGKTLAGPGTEVGDGWKLAKVWNLAGTSEGVSGKTPQPQEENQGQQDVSNVGIFTKDKTCVLAFAGTSNATDAQRDMDVGSKPFCGKVTSPNDRGWSVHEGFGDRANDFLKGAKFEEFRSFLSDKKTCDKVVVAGHSLGGSVANLVAACSNKTHAASKSPSFKADYLFTFGAPGVSKSVQLDNTEDSRGCFAGARVYNSEDPIPSLTNPLDFFHPKVMEVRLDGQGDGEVQTWNCDNVTSRDKPEVDLEASNSETHSMTFHIERMKMLEGKGADVFKWGMEDFNGASPVQVDNGASPQIGKGGKCGDSSHGLNLDAQQPESRVPSASKSATDLETPAVEPEVAIKSAKDVQAPVVEAPVEDAPR